MNSYHQVISRAESAFQIGRLVKTAALVTTATKVVAASAKPTLSDTPSIAELNAIAAATGAVGSQGDGAGHHEADDQEGVEERGR